MSKRSARETIPLSVVSGEEFPARTYNAAPRNCGNCPLGSLRGSERTPLQCVGRVTLDTVVLFKELYHPDADAYVLMSGGLAESSGEARYKTRICGVGLGPLTPGSIVRQTFDLATRQAARKFAAEVRQEGSRLSPPHSIELLTSPRLPHASPEDTYGRLHYGGVNEIDAGLPTRDLLRADATERFVQGIELYPLLVV